MDRSILRTPAAMGTCGFVRRRLGLPSSIHRRYVLFSKIGPRTRALIMAFSGWGRKLSYCIAFSIDGATDVTRRYVRNPAKHGSPRNKVSEQVLLWVIYEIRRLRREKADTKLDRRRLLKEDEREERELRGYTASALAAEISGLLPGRLSPRSEEQKTPVSRDEGAAEWLNATQSGGTGSDRPGGGR